MHAAADQLCSLVYANSYLSLLILLLIESEDHLVKQS